MLQVIFLQSVTNKLQSAKHFIWDFDGTLFDTYPLIVSSFRKAFRENGVTLTREEIYRQMMRSIPEAFDFFLEKYHVDSQKVAAVYRREVGMESPLTSPPFRSAQPLVARICTSGKCNYLYTHRDNSANVFLAANDMTQFFTETVTQENGFQKKPDPGALDYLTAKYHMEKSETVMVGDRAIDIECGKNAGLLTCHITNGLPISIKADFVYENLEEMYRSLG